MVNKKKRSSAPASAGNVVSIVPAQGINYNIPAFEFPWDIKEITIEDIEKYKFSIYVYKVVSNLTNLIFQGDYICNILDPKGNSREDIAEWFRVMLQDINFDERLRNTFQSWCIYGNYFHSDGAARIGGRAVYTEIRELPPESLAFYGLVYSADYDYGKIFKGVCKDPEGNLHYWQKQKYDSVELENCSHIKSPVYTHNIDGVPILTPVYKLIPKLDFSLSTLMQCENRAGAPTIFMQVLQPGKLPDGKTDNWNYSNQVLKNYDKNTLFTIPASLNPIEVTSQVPDISLKALDFLTKLVISLYSTSDLISKGEGTLIGGSTSSEMGLVKSFVVGFHKPIIKAWTNILNSVLEWNGFEGFKVELILPEPEFKNEELDLARAKEIIQAVKDGLVLGDVNEVRTFFGLEDGSPEFFEKCKGEWENLQIETTAQKNLQMQLEQERELNARQPAGENNNKIIEKNKPAGSNKETLENEEVEDNQKEKNMKGNQGIPAREDTEAQLQAELSDHWETFFNTMFTAMTAKNGRK